MMMMNTSAYLPDQPAAAAGHHHPSKGCTPRGSVDFPMELFDLAETQEDAEAGGDMVPQTTGPRRPSIAAMPGMAISLGLLAVPEAASRLAGHRGSFLDTERLLHDALSPAWESGSGGGGSPSPNPNPSAKPAAAAAAVGANEQVVPEATALAFNQFMASQRASATQAAAAQQQQQQRQQRMPAAAAAPGAFPPSVGGASPAAGGSREGTPEPYSTGPCTPAERKRRKLASNRRAARKFREKKKMEMQKVYETILRLETANAELQRELALIATLKKKKPAGK